MIYTSLENCVHMRPPMIPAVAPIACPDREALESCADGAITIITIDKNVTASNLLLVTISQLIIPNNTPEKPILHGIFGYLLWTMASTMELNTSKNIIRAMNCFEPMARSTRDKAYKAVKFPIRWAGSICKKLL